MILTPHLLIGAAIATKISDPILALPLAFLSHYFLDLFPHTEYSVKNILEKHWREASRDFFKVFGDILAGIFLILLFADSNLIIFAAALLAMTPDGLHFLKILFSQNKLLIRHQEFHEAVNNICNPEENKKIAPFWGITIQVLIIIIALFLL